MALVLKTNVRFPYRGFESLSLRGFQNSLFRSKTKAFVFLSLKIRILEITAPTKERMKLPALTDGVSPFSALRAVPRHAYLVV